MTTEYLNRYIELSRQINQHLTQTMALMDVATSTTGRLDGDNVQGGNSDKIGSIVTRIVDIEKDVDGQIDEMRIVKSNIQNAIAELPDIKQRRIMLCRYIQGMTYQATAKQCHLSVRHTIRLHNAAVNEMFCVFT